VTLCFGIGFEGIPVSRMASIDARPDIDRSSLMSK
jgi:hypothetical protein